MATQEFNCPQFVDFTSNEAFDIHDGADYCFEKGVVGEIDLGFGLSNDIKQDQNDSGEMERLLAVFRNSTNLGLSNQVAVEKTTQLKMSDQNDLTSGSPMKPQKCAASSPKLPMAGKVVEVSTSDKENVSKICSPSSSLSSAVKSAIDVAAALKIESSSSTNEAREVKNVKPATPTLHIAKIKTNTPTLTKQQQRNRTNSGNTQVPVSNGGSLISKVTAKVSAAFKLTKNGTTTSTIQMGTSSLGVDHRSLKSRLTSSKTKSSKMGEPLKVEHADSTTSGPKTRNDRSSSSNRRCSSVPRTLKEKHALARSGIVGAESGKTIGEKIQNFFGGSTNSANASASFSRSRQNTMKTTAKPVPLKPTSTLPSKKIGNTSMTAQQSNTSKTTRNTSYQADRRRSRSCNESISAHRNKLTKTSGSIDASTNENDSAKSRLNSSRHMHQSPCVSGQRTRSGERAPALPLYTGVKFIPKSTPKYSANASDGLLANKNRLADDVLKTRPNFMAPRRDLMQMSSFKPSTTNAIHINHSYEKKPTTSSVPSSVLNTTTVITKTTAPTTLGKSSSFKQSAASKQNESLNGTINASQTNATKPKSSVMSRYLNNSATSASASTSLMSGGSIRVRKKSETSVVTGAPSFLHTELRAQKRQEFEQAMKEKDRLVENLKRDMEQNKLRQQQEEIQKIRMQRTFRSRPIKHYKGIQVKPSDKPLTEPKSPHISHVSHTSSSNLHTTSRPTSNDTFNTNTSYNRQRSASSMTKSTSNANLSTSHVAIIKGAKDHDISKTNTSITMNTIEPLSQEDHS